jgi:SAM-dependent methyltransferase
MEKFYRTHLAKIHDLYYGDLARNASLEIINYLKDKKLTGKKLIDVGCGSGILASLLSEEGFEVIGIDISEDILEIAKKNSPKAKFIHASLFDYNFPAANVVTCIGEPINYLFDGRSNYADLFKRIYNCLSSPGIFVFDILTTNVDKEPQSRIIEKDEMTMFLEISVNQDYQFWNGR